jgi:hypothetical protein
MIPNDQDNASHQRESHEKRPIRVVPSLRIERGHREATERYLDRDISIAILNRETIQLRR